MPKKRRSRRKDPVPLLQDVIVEMLEQFTFMLAAASEPPRACRDPEGCRVASMFIEGPDRVRVRAAAPLALCREFARNVLGMEGGKVTVDIAEDAMEEFLNIVAGRFAALYYGDQEVVELTPPEVTRITEAEWMALHREEEVLFFDVEGRPLAADLEIIRKRNG
jgi:hypothetical protein